jgi:UPF0755 protein
MMIDLRPGQADFGSESDFRVRPRRWLYVALLFAFIGAVAASVALVLPSESFTSPKLLEIRSGESFSEVATTLEREGVVRSAFLLRVIAKLTGKDTNAIAGPYRFDGSDDVFDILRRLTKGDHGIAMKRITIPEGLTRNEMADIFARELPRFSREEFLLLTEQEEGLLFPDTYEFFETATSGTVRERMRATFEERTANLRALARPQNASWKDIIIMASIIEKEVPLPDDRRIVSGILWKRLDIGMPLQVDAVFKYAIGRGSAELTQEDLREDSPYNTYTRKGLPPTAIGSPSLDALTAAIQPTDSPYLFYLSGADGTTRFAKNFEEHKRNREQYMR